MRYKVGSFTDYYLRTTGAVYSAAKAYSGAIETAATVISTTVGVAGSCIKATASTIEDAYEAGPSKTAKSLVAWSLGGNNFKAGIEALKTHHRVFEDESGAKMTLKDKRSYATRIGHMGGNFLMGIGKIVTTGTTLTGTAAYATGTVCNLMGSQAKLMTAQGASQALATGVNTGASYGLSYGWVVTKYSLWGAGKAFTALATTRLGLTAVGMAATLYIASSQAVKAGDAETVGGKVKHSLAATAALAATVAIPLITYTDCIMGI